MEHRSEPRFQVSASGWVARLGHMDQPYECRVMDVSGAGIRLRTQAQIRVEEVVCLGFHEHVLVIRIRNVRPQSDGLFAVGAERVCSFPSEEFQEGQPTFRRLRELLAEKGWDIEVDTAAAVLPSPVRPEPPPQQRRGAGDGLVAIALVAMAVVVLGAAGFFYFEQRRERMEVVPPLVIGPVGAAPADAAPVAVAPAGAAPVHPALVHPAPVTPVPVTPAPVKAAPVAQAPQPVVNAQQPASARTSSAMHHVKISVLEPAWLTASADGKALLDRGRMYGKDGSFEFDFSKLAYVHLGNSRGVTIAMDGKLVTLPQPHPVVGVLELTPAGSRLLPWSNGDPVSEPGR